MAAQVNFCLFLNVFFCLACNTAPENWHICVNRGLTYLLIYLKKSLFIIPKSVPENGPILIGLPAIPERFFQDRFHLQFFKHVIHLNMDFFKGLSLLILK